MLIPIHEEMTREALGEHFSPRALEIIIAANRKQDALHQRTTRFRARLSAFPRRALSVDRFWEIDSYGAGFLLSYQLHLPLA